VGEHVDDAFDTQCRAGVDPADAALGDGGGDDAAVKEVRGIELGGIFGGTSDLAWPSMRGMAAPT
jgi:hypothetical protein